MDSAEVTAIVAKAIEVSLVVSTPFLAAALFTGVTVSLLQSVTQIQEQTLTFVPKLLVIMGVFVVLFPWLLDVMNVYITDLYSMFPEVGP